MTKGLKFLLTGAVFYLLPLLLKVPTFKFSRDNIIYLGITIIVYFAVIFILAREKYLGWLSLLPLAAIVIVLLSHIKIQLTVTQTVIYYATVTVAVVLSVITQLLNAEDAEDAADDDDDDDDE